VAKETNINAKETNIYAKERDLRALASSFGNRKCHWRWDILNMCLE